MHLPPNLCAVLYGLHTHYNRNLCALQNGGIQPLVRLLRDDPDEISAELSAVVLRNLALQNAVNRAAIKDAGGLQPLLRLLSMGQEKLVYPLTCEVISGSQHMFDYTGPSTCSTVQPTLLLECVDAGCV